jgi:hypothetical protein
MIDLPTLLVILAIACPAAIAAYVAICNSLDRGILYQLRLLISKGQHAARQAPKVVIREVPVISATAFGQAVHIENGQWVSDDAKAVLDAAFKPRDHRGRFQSRTAFVHNALAGKVGQ